MGVLFAIGSRSGVGHGPNYLVDPWNTHASRSTDCFCNPCNYRPSRKRRRERNPRSIYYRVSTTLAMGLSVSRIDFKTLTDQIYKFEEK